MSASSAPQPRALGVLRAIAAFKFVKAAFVVATVFGLLHVYDPKVAAYLSRLAHDLPYAFEQKLVSEAIAFLSGISPRQIHLLATAGFAYAGLFLVEGVGLWLGLHWAEILTVVATSSLIPVEVYEVHHRLTASRVLVLIGNVAIVGYLIWRLRREASQRHAAVARPEPRG